MSCEGSPVEKDSRSTNNGDGGKIEQVASIEKFQSLCNVAKRDVLQVSSETRSSPHGDKDIYSSDKRLEFFISSLFNVDPVSVWLISPKTSKLSNRLLQTFV